MMLINDVITVQFILINDVKKFYKAVKQKQWRC